MPGKVHAKYGKLTAKRMANASNQAEQALASLGAILESVENELGPEAIEAILTEMQNLAKNPARPGAWQDRTGNLRDSIMIEVLAPGESRVVNYGHGSASATNDSSEMMVGILYAGMEYAVPLEALSNYSVLGFAVEQLKKRLTPKLAEMLQFQKITGSQQFEM